MRRILENLVERADLVISIPVADAAVAAALKVAKARLTDQK